MSPALAAPSPPVVTDTLVPALSAASMVAVLRFEVATVPLGTQAGQPFMLEFAALVMVTLAGSSSHVPDLPWGAAASAGVVTLSTPWLEVSINPPLPPWGPPFACTDPLTVV